MINEDIGALLAEVNAELISQKNDHDDYELNFESDDNNNDDDDNDHIHKNSENFNSKNNDNDKVIDTSKILKDAAQTIQQEEKVLLDKVITNVSNEIKIIITIFIIILFKCHLNCVEILIKNKAKRSKVNFLNEKPKDCIGESKHTRTILELLGE